MSSKEVKDRLRKQTKKDGNTACADCHAPRPTWVSLIVLPETQEHEAHHEIIPRMLGTFICFRCSGVQRGIGSKFCVVRSMALDMWTEHEVKSLELGGNVIVNSAFEAKEVTTERPETRAPMNVRKVFLNDKYVEKKFLDMDKLEQVLHQIASSQTAEAEAQAATEAAAQAEEIKEKATLEETKVEEEHKQEEEETKQAKANVDLDSSMDLDQETTDLPQNDIEPSSDNNNNASAEGSMQFNDSKLFPSPQATEPKPAAEDEKPDNEFPEDFPNFPDFDNSKPDLMTKDTTRSESITFGDVRQSFLATVPETNLAGNTLLVGGEFEDDKFDNDDDEEISSQQDQEEPQALKPQTSIVFEDLFAEGNDDGNSKDGGNSTDDDEFGMDSSFRVSPRKTLPVEEETEQPEPGESSDSPPLTGVSQPAPTPGEQPEESETMHDDISSTHSSQQMSHDSSSHSSHSSADEGSKAKYNTTEDPTASQEQQQQQDPFGAEFSFPEEPLPPPGDVVESSDDDPFKADGTTQDAAETKDPFAPDAANKDPFASSDGGENDVAESQPQLDEPFKADPFGTQDAASNTDIGENDDGEPFQADAFGTQDAESKDPLASEGGENDGGFPSTESQPMDDPFKGDAFGAQDAADKDPFASSGGENDGVVPSTESQPVDEAFKADAFGTQDAANNSDGGGNDEGEPFKADSFDEEPLPSSEDVLQSNATAEDPISSDGGESLDSTAKAEVVGEQVTGNADPFALDGSANAFSANSSKDESFQPMASAFDGADNAFSASSMKEEEFQPMPSAFKGSISDSELPFSFDGADEEFKTMPSPFKASVSTSEIPLVKEDAFAAFDKPSTPLEEDAFGEDAFAKDAFSDDTFGQQDETNTDPFGASDDEDFSASVNNEEEFFNVDNSFRIDSLSQSERVGRDTFKVTPSNRKRSTSADADIPFFEEEETKVRKNKPPSLESAFKKMSQRDVSMSSRGTDEASIASSSSRPSVRSVRTAPMRSRSRSMDKDEGVSTPTSVSGRGKRHTLQIGTRSFNSAQPRRSKPKRRQSNDGAMGEFVSDDSLARSGRSESQFGGSRRQRRAGNRSLSPFTELTRASTGKSGSGDDESSLSKRGSDGVIRMKKTFRPATRSRSLDMTTGFTSNVGAKPGRRMPQQNEGGADKPIRKTSSSENVSDDGFSNVSTARSTMTGWSDFDADTGSAHSSLSHKMSVVEEATASSYTHVAEELNAAAGRSDLAKRRMSGDLAKRRSSGDHRPKQRNHLVKIESARSKVRRKEEVLAGLMHQNERRGSLPSTPSLRAKLEADETAFERKGTSVDGGMDRQKRESRGKKKFVLFPHKTHAPERAETG